MTDLGRLGERQVKIDCDVIQADGGTRTAAITGAYVALALAFEKLVRGQPDRGSPLERPGGRGFLRPLSKATPVLDLDYAEDSACQADANFVLTAAGGIVEVQGTAEKDPFTEAAVHGPAGAGPRRHDRTVRTIARQGLGR